MRIKESSHPFSPRTLPSTVRETGARKGAASADKVSFGANKVLALKFLTLTDCLLMTCFYFNFPLYFKFQARLPDQNFILAANYCHMLLFFFQMFHCVLGTCVILIVLMFPKLRIQWGQKVFIFSVFP